jgi:hypothetical protein
MPKKRTTKKRKLRRGKIAKPKARPKGERPRESAGHVCFARGELNALTEAEGLHPISATDDVADEDWEFFTDRHGISLWRSKAGGTDLVVTKSGKKPAQTTMTMERFDVRLQLLKGEFMGRVRWPRQVICRGARQVMNACERLRTATPAKTLAHRDRQRAREASERPRTITEIRSAQATEPTPEAPQSAAPGTDLPSGWKTETRTTTKDRRYKVYTAPDGRRFQSRKQALAHASADSGATEATATTTARA